MDEETEVTNLIDRACAIEAALQDPFIPQEQAFALLDELAEIETKLQQM